MAKSHIVKRLFYGKFSKYAISLILGLGLASLFRKACNSRNCLVFKAPPMEKVKSHHLLDHGVLKKI